MHGLLGAHNGGKAGKWHWYVSFVTKTVLASHAAVPVPSPACLLAGTEPVLSIHPAHRTQSAGMRTLVYLVAEKMSSNLSLSTLQAAVGCKKGSCARRAHALAELPLLCLYRYRTGLWMQDTELALDGQRDLLTCSSAKSHGRPQPLLPRRRHERPPALGQRPVGLLLVHEDDILQHGLQSRRNTSRC